MRKKREVLAAMEKEEARLDASLSKLLRASTCVKKGRKACKRLRLELTKLKEQENARRHEKKGALPQEPHDFSMEDTGIPFPQEPLLGVEVPHAQD